MGGVISVLRIFSKRLKTCPRDGTRPPPLRHHSRRQPLSARLLSAAPPQRQLRADRSAEDERSTHRRRQLVRAPGEEEHLWKHHPGHWLHVLLRCRLHGLQQRLPVESSARHTASEPRGNEPRQRSRGRRRLKCLLWIWFA